MTQYGHKMQSIRYVIMYDKHMLGIIISSVHLAGINMYDVYMLDALFYGESELC